LANCSLLLGLSGVLTTSCTAKKDEAAIADTSAPAMAPAPAAMDTGMKMDTTAEIVIRADSVSPPDSVRTAGRHQLPRDDRLTRLVLPKTDTIGARVIESGTTFTRADSAVIETQLKNLRAASIEFYAPDTLFISRPELVTIVIDPQTTATQPKVRRGRIRPATTRVSYRTEVCLSAPGLKVDDDEGTDKHCREQVIPFTAASQWHWTVTALAEIKTSGVRPIDITVNALLDSLPKYTVYTTHHTAYVHVDDPGIMLRLQSLLTTWQALLLSIAAIVGVIYPFVRWLMARGRKT
jgi:hypothetical protein